MPNAQGQHREHGRPSACFRDPASAGQHVEEGDGLLCVRVPCPRRSAGRTASDHQGTLHAPVRRSHGGSPGKGAGLIPEPFLETLREIHEKKPHTTERDCARLAVDIICSLTEQQAVDFYRRLHRPLCRHDPRSNRLLRCDAPHRIRGADDSDHSIRDSREVGCIATPMPQPSSCRCWPHADFRVVSRAEARADLVTASVFKTDESSRER